MNRTPAGRPAPRPNTPVRRPAPQRRRRMRPAAVALICVMVLLLCLIAFLVTYQIVYRAELSRLQNSGGAITDTGEKTQGEKTDDSAPSSEVLFSSPAEIASYVDALSIDLKDLKNFKIPAVFESVLLKETADAGDSYQNETVYIGDSLVLHMKSDFSHPTSLVYGAESITPEDACVKKLTKKRDGGEATFAEAMKELKPKRIVITIGTNSAWMEGKTYLQFFSRFIDQLKEATPNTKIILQSVPPVTAQFEKDKSYPTNEKINRLNLYLAGLASYHEIFLLDSAPLLKNADGTLDTAYSAEDGFHLNARGYDVWVSYMRTHALNLQK